MEEIEFEAALKEYLNYKKLFIEIIHMNHMNVV